MIKKKFFFVKFWIKFSCFSLQTSKQSQAKMMVSDCQIPWLTMVGVRHMAITNHGRQRFVKLSKMIMTVDYGYYFSSAMKLMLTHQIYYIDYQTWRLTIIIDGQWLWYSHIYVTIVSHDQDDYSWWYLMVDHEMRWSTMKYHLKPIKLMVDHGHLFAWEY